MMMMMWKAKKKRRRQWWPRRSAGEPTREGRHTAPKTANNEKRENTTDEGERRRSGDRPGLRARSRTANTQSGAELTALWRERRREEGNVRRGATADNRKMYEKTDRTQKDQRRGEESDLFLSLMSSLLFPPRVCWICCRERTTLNSSWRIAW
jgi:hypothetical protein